MGIEEVKEKKPTLLYHKHAIEITQCGANVYVCELPEFSSRCTTCTKAQHLQSCGYCGFTEVLGHLQKSKVS